MMVNLDYYWFFTFYFEHTYTNLMLICWLTDFVAVRLFILDSNRKLSSLGTLLHICCLGLCHQVNH